MKSCVLLVENTASLEAVYAAVLDRAGHRVVSASNALEGLRVYERERPEVVLIDLSLPDRDGLLLLRECRKLGLGGQFIVIAEGSGLNRAVNAVRAGAHDFLITPFAAERLSSAVANAMQDHSNRREPIPFENKERMLGTSPALSSAQARISAAARSMGTVFLKGEPGTGKSLAASAIHAASSRFEHPFVKVALGSIPLDLQVDYVLGADETDAGALLEANGGTIFFEEISNMAPKLQSVLPHFLQTRTVQRKNDRPRKLNVRVICSSARDLEPEVRRGRFRADLFDWLDVLSFEMPPLRMRGEDVIAIAEARLTAFTRDLGRRFIGFEDEVRHLFRTYRWPGNIRELETAIEFIVATYDDALVDVTMLPVEMQSDALATGRMQEPSAVVADPLAALEGMTLAEIERLVIEGTIARMGGSVPKAARVLNVSPSTIYRKREGWASHAPSVIRKTAI